MNCFRQAWRDLFGPVKPVQPRVIGGEASRPDWSKKLANGMTINIHDMCVTGVTIDGLRQVPPDCRQEAVDFLCARMTEHVRTQAFR